jgi:methionyl-tRNA synthetase
MFRLSQYREPLIQWLQDNPTVIRPVQRYNEVMSYLQAGDMGDLSISRPRARLQWGIEVPDDPSQTVYVWMDALLNYLSYTGYPDKHAQLWPANMHVIGKDIIRFHAVYWPAILMALDLPLPKQILAHAHWTMGNFKMSKSRGNVVNPFQALQDYTPDGVRFFLMSKGGLASDSGKQRKALQLRHKD